jgi:putative ribosomal protein
MGEYHPAEKKVVVEFAPKDLGLTEVQTDKLRKLVGTRYNPTKDSIKMSCESFGQPAQNKRYLSDLVDKLIAEAKVCLSHVFPSGTRRLTRPGPQGYLRGRPPGHEAPHVQDQAQVPQGVVPDQGAQAGACGAAGAGGGARRWQGGRGAAGRRRQEHRDVPGPADQAGQGWQGGAGRRRAGRDGGGEPRAPGQGGREAGAQVDP